MVKRIIYFYNKVVDSTNLEGGGAEVVYKQAKWMAKQGHEVYLVTSNIAPPLNVEYKVREFSKEGINFIRLKGYTMGGVPPLNRRVFIPDAPKVIEQLTDGHKCVVHVHFHLTPLMWAVIIAAKKNKAKVIYQPHLHPPYAYPKEEKEFRLGYFRSLFRKEVGLSDMVIAITGLEKNIIKRLCKRKRVDVVSNPIDITDFEHKAGKKRVFAKYGFRKEDKFILYVGKLEKRKNPLEVAKVFKNVHKRIANVKLIYVGKKGDSYEETRKYLSRNRLMKDVVFTGFVSDSIRNKLYSLAHVFILLSIYEAFGISVAQASYNRLPIIVSHVGGLSDIVHEKTGYLVPSKKRVEKVSKYVVELLRNKPKRIEMGKEGRKYVIKHFMIDNCFRRLERTYRSLFSV